MSRHDDESERPGTSDAGEASNRHDGRIDRLPAAAVERIAAGEVVTAPVDAVAELVENALDAGADRIAVEVDGDGCDRVLVRDDGRGMVPSDAVRAFERHATSKLQSPSDVARVETLGFRGEALAAVAEAAESVELTTRADGHEAVTVRVDGTVDGPEPAARGVGTTVEVCGLFDDRPARRESLASPAREFAKVSRTVSRYALVRPDVCFEVVHDDREVLQAPGSGDRVEALLATYDRDAAGAAVEVADRAGPVRVEGLVCRPSLSRASREHVHVAVGGRAVRDSDLRRAVAEGYDGLLSPDRYPVAVVDVTVPPERVDVNVHPRKRSVAFADADAVGDAVATAVSEALSTADVEAVAAHADLGAVAEPVAGGPLADAEIVGIFRDLYVLCERGDELLVVDAHAAHERVTYERLLEAAGDVPGVGVEPPTSVALSAGEAALLRDERVRASVERLGFRVDVCGDDTARVSRVPAPTADAVAPEALRDVVDAVAAERSAAGRPEDVLDSEQSLVDLACHESLRAGEVTRETAEDLLTRLGSCDRPDACPHGRPTVLTVDEADLARGFDRPNTRFD